MEILTIKERMTPGIYRVTAEHVERGERRVFRVLVLDTDNDAVVREALATVPPAGWRIASVLPEPGLAHYYVLASYDLAAPLPSHRRRR